MELKYGVISCDDHIQLDQDNWTKRMSEKKWGSKIPQIRPTQDPSHMAVDWGEPDTWRWFVYDNPESPRGVANCPTAMQDPKWGDAGARRKYFPQRWSDVPRSIYEPGERLKSMDHDGIDAAVLFPNDPCQSGTFFQGNDPEFELEAIRAYNDGIIEWAQTSDRLIPLALIPYLNNIETICGEVERTIKAGLKGISILSEPRMTNNQLAHFNDPYWDPLWALCQDLDIPIHWHLGAGLKLSMPQWKGYTRNESQAMGPCSAFCNVAQFIPNLIFSGVLDRYPSLKWVCAETGLGWVNYVLEGCDHEWERRHLWTEGITTKPSELFQRQVLVDFWYESAGVEMRHNIGMNNIMWEADFPHSTSTWPQSWEFINRTLEGVPQSERNQLLYGNAVKLYKLD